MKADTVTRSVDDDFKFVTVKDLAELIGLGCGTGDTCEDIAAVKCRIGQVGKSGGEFDLFQSYAVVEGALADGGKR